MNEFEETRKKIMDAAETLFLQYGFGKTTMVEIADECGMSAANIYRFYKNKKELAAELTSLCFAKTEETLREILALKGVNASERLELFILKMLHLTYQVHSNEPKLDEIVDFISNERFEIIIHHNQAKQSMIAEILAEGNLNNEFKVDNLLQTSEMILKATVSLHYPKLITRYPLPELERIANGVIRLIINGVK